ncbi:HD domain-containing protein [Lutimonas halocynthiae]|uniref:HD domain-containing protein n=1 Tax=Lutimonas halocynthiae TaxID=1446477 RepID=UPI0025B3AF87|nr:HD domain-containing protein [Lutimonas halocynthiae]MDN3641796.1 HD domain-containing protein [Lutimonas halocynthiae]
MDLQTPYQKAIKFAGEKHDNQKVPGSQSSYLAHLSNVAMEIMVAAQHTDNFDQVFAVQVALLHDVLEDTSTTYDELQSVFGKKIADGVLALSKDETLKAEARIPDSLSRIKKQPKEVWAVKLADRISNMQEPPEHWDKNKRMTYLKMAGIILFELKGGNAYLEKRLEQKIIDYQAYIPVDGS